MGQFVRANSRPGRRGYAGDSWQDPSGLNHGDFTPSWQDPSGLNHGDFTPPSQDPSGLNHGDFTPPWQDPSGLDHFTTHPVRRTVFPNAGGGNNQTINPLGVIGRGIRGLGHKLQGLRGWNLDGTPKTQLQWEEEREQRIAQKRINNILGRDAPATKATNINLNRLYDTLRTPKTGRNLFTEGEINKRVSPAMRQIYQTPDYKLMEGQGTTDFNRLSKNEGINKAEPGLTMMEEFYNKPITQRWADQTGMDLQEARALKIDPNLKGMEWLNEKVNWADTASNLGERDRYKEAYPEITWKEVADKARSGEFDWAGSVFNPALKELDYGGKKGPFYGGVMGEVEPQFENIIGGGGREFLNIADPDLKGSYQENLQTGGYYDEPYEQYLEKNYPKTIPSLQKKGQWLSQGGRVGYNTGGRVGILAAF